MNAALGGVESTCRLLSLDESSGLARELRAPRTPMSARPGDVAEGVRDMILNGIQRPEVGSPFPNY